MAPALLVGCVTRSAELDGCEDVRIRLKEQRVGSEHAKSEECGAKTATKLAERKAVKDGFRSVSSLSEI